MVENDTFTESDAAFLRRKLAHMLQRSFNGRLLIDIGYTLPEVENLARRVGSIGQRALGMHPADPRLRRLHHLLGENPGMEAVLVDSVGILLGTGGWLVTPTDRPATFNRFLDNLVWLGERLAARKQVPDA